MRVGPERMRIVGFALATAVLDPGIALSAQTYVLMEFNGTSPGDQLGSAVAALGDLDGDGVPELIVGAPQGASPAPGPGKAMVYSGGSGALLLSLSGAMSGDRFGLSVAAAGDVDGDSVPDLLVGAPQGDATVGSATGAGYVKVISGSTGSELSSLSGTGLGDRFGFSVAGLGDVNGDGFSDVAVGAPFADPGGVSDAGRTTVFSGASSGVLVVLDGTSAGDTLGWSLAAVGDLDGDTASDVAVGATQIFALTSGTGYVLVASGSSGSILFALAGAGSSYDAFGWSVAGPGDVDGDGVPDIFVGDPEPIVPFGPGYAILFSGATGSPLHQIQAIYQHDLLGYSVAGGVDVDGMGSPDLIVGVPNSPAVGGHVEVHAGESFGTLLLTSTWTAGVGALGSAIAAGGDLNGDGFGDLLVGAPLAGSMSAGTAQVLSIAGVPSGSSVFGSPCAGSGGQPPLVQATGGLPIVGSAGFGLALSNALGPAGVLLIAGPTAVSVPLGFIGLAGCTLLVDPQFVLPLTTSVTGVAFVSLPIPPVPALANGHVYFQFYVVDPGPAAIPGAMTQGLDLVILP